jgi:hypothetical protein
MNQSPATMLLPTTLVALRPISRRGSIPSSNAKPASGILNVAKVPAITTKEALGTPAMPLLVSISTSNMLIWVESGKSMPYDWAINSEANVMYIMLPSRLKEYPSGSTKLTTVSLQPNFPNSSIVFGKAASLLVVEKAYRTGTFTCRINDITRLPMTQKPARISEDQSRNRLT